MRDRHGKRRSTDPLFSEIGAGGSIDTTAEFYKRINALVDPDFVVLDFGPGRGAAHWDDVVRYSRSFEISGAKSVR
jgi:hypothetical protein